MWVGSYLQGAYQKRCVLRSESENEAMAELHAIITKQNPGLEVSRDGRSWMGPGFGFGPSRAGAVVSIDAKTAAEWGLIPPVSGSATPARVRSGPVHVGAMEWSEVFKGLGIQTKPKAGA